MSKNAVKKEVFPIKILKDEEVFFCFQNYHKMMKKKKPRIFSSESTKNFIKKGMKTYQKR